MAQQTRSLAANTEVLSLISRTDPHKFSSDLHKHRESEGRRRGRGEEEEEGYIQTYHMNVDVYGGQKRALHPLVLELQVILVGFFINNST